MIDYLNKKIAFFVSLIIFFYVAFTRHFLINDNFVLHDNFNVLTLIIAALILILFFFKINKQLVTLIIFLPLIFGLFFLKNNILFTSGNNDIYSWSLISNHMLGYANIFNIKPDGESFINSIGRLTQGAYIINAFLPALFKQNAIELVSFNIMFLNISTQLAIFYFLRLCKLPNRLSIFISILWVINPVIIYLSSNYFYAHLLSYFYLFILLSIYIEFRNSLIILRSISLLPVIYLMLISYESSFLVFVFASIIIVFIYEISINDKYFINKSKEIILMYLYIFIFSLVLFSSDLMVLFGHVTHLSHDINTGSIGWSLPPFNPLTLIGIPLMHPVDIPSNYYKYIYLFILIYILCYLFINKINVGLKRFKKNNYLEASFSLILNIRDAAKKLFLILFIFLVLYAILFFATNHLPNNYIVWKFATYFFTPICFFTFYMGAYLYLKNVNFYKKYILIYNPIHKIYFSIILFIFFIYIGHYLYKKQIKSFDNQVSNIHSSVTNFCDNDIACDVIVLDTAPWKSTFLTFNILSNSFVLYPCAPTYIRPAEKSDILKITNDQSIVTLKQKNDTFSLNKFNIKKDCL